MFEVVKKIKEALKEPFQIKINFDCHSVHSIIIDIWWYEQNFTWATSLTENFNLEKFIQDMQETEQRLIAGDYK